MVTRLVKDGITNLVETYDVDRFNLNASVAENLLFGTPIGPAFDFEALADNTYVSQVLAKVGLIDDLVDAGKQVAETMVELFADLPPDHEFFEQFSFISSNDLPEFAAILGRIAQFPGDFCAKGARFGTHEMPRRIFAPYYGKLLIVAFFNAGLQVFDIRDPYNPRRVGYFIQAPNRNTQQTCGTFQGNTNYCRRATFSDLGELDDRGYICNMDRAGSGLTILQLTGAALEVVTAHGENDN